jgi:hypothetical protein
MKARPSLTCVRYPFSSSSRKVVSTVEYAKGVRFGIASTTSPTVAEPLSHSTSISRNSASVNPIVFFLAKASPLQTMELIGAYYGAELDLSTMKLIVQRNKKRSPHHNPPEEKALLRQQPADYLLTSDNNCLRILHPA